MSASRAAVLVVGGGLLAAWVAAAAGGARSSAVATESARAVGARTADVPLPVGLDRLAARAATRRAYTPPRRNLFQFTGSRSAQAAQAGDAFVAALASAAAAFVAAPPPPVWQLAGIAESRDGDRIVRTAIISGQGTVFLVRDGEQLAGRFLVVRIESDTVALRDVRDGTSLTLRLK